jgi:hypothetical protein
MTVSEPPKGSVPPVEPANETILKGVEQLLSTHEIRVLGAMGLFIGYMSIFIVKILEYQDMHLGVAFVILTTVSLMFLDKERKPYMLEWWTRVFVVVLLTLFITSPQLYNAWTVAVLEQKMATQEHANQEKAILATKQTQPIITITNGVDKK